MDFSLIQLLLSFLFSIALGLSFGIVYEGVRIYRVLGYNKASHYFISDILFVIICTFFTYFFCLVMLEGKVRMFVIAGVLLGLFAYLRFIAPITDKIIIPIVKFSKKVLTKLLKNGLRIMYNIGRKLGNIFSFLKNILRYIERKVNKMVKNNGRKENKAQRKTYRKNKRSKNKKE